MLARVKKYNLDLNISRIFSTSFSLILTYSVLCLAIFLRVKQFVSSTIALGVDLSIGLGVPTVFVLGTRCFLLFHQRTTTQTGSVLTRPVVWLELTCRRGIKCSMWLWVGLSGWNLMLAARAPSCLDKPLEKWQSQLVENSWRFGLSCKVHRAIVALSITLAFSLFLVYFVTYCRSSHGSGGSGSVLSYDKEDRLYLVPDRRVSRIDREQWLQRRNSMSSQRAMFPHKHHYFDSRPRYATYSFAQSNRYSSTLGSVSEGACLDLSDRSSSLNSSQSSGSFARSRRPSTYIPRVRANSNPEKLITVRQDKNVLKEATPAVPPLPPAPAPTWCPALNHAPLSADPTIHALSTGAGGGLRASLCHSRSSPAFLALLPPRARLVEPVVMVKSGASASDCSVLAKSSASPALGTPTTAPLEPPTARPPLGVTKIPPQPTIPPPPPPLTSILPLVSQPLIAASTPPPIPVRAPGHTLHRTNTNPSIKPTLRRPSPIRHRHYHHHHKNYHYTPQQHMQQYQQLQAQAALLHQQQQQYHHGRYRRQNPSSSIYSGSSYGTRASSAYTPTPTPTTGNVIAVRQ